MKYNIMLHFIWVFTVCIITRLGVSWTQRVNKQMIEIVYFKDNQHIKVKWK